MNRPLVIGVAGGSGSGKSTVVRQMLDLVPALSVSLLHHDSYYRDHADLPLEERARINYDHPDSLETPLLAEHLRELIAGRPVEVPQYDFSTHRRLTETRRVEPQPVIIVDGILVLAEPELRELCEIRAYVETDADVRFIRRLLRDTRERQRSVESVIAQYSETVRPMHLEFVEPSKRHAHVIIPFGGENSVAIEMLAAQLKERVRRGPVVRGNA